MQFALYDSLARAAETATFDKELFTQRLTTDGPNLPEAHRKIIFLLVYHHWLLNHHRSRSKGLPYKSKPMTGGKGVIQNFPADFAPILSVYFDRISA
jgi:hypothetical protein